MAQAQIAYYEGFDPLELLLKIHGGITKAARKVFGSKNERELKRMASAVARVNETETSIRALSDEDLRARTPALKEKLAQGASLDDLLPEAFAVSREAARRTLGMRHFDVQLIGGIVLHEGRIAEMKTGEGKTLVATLPVYLNALAGKGVHVITVNDYLARRDAEWMGRVYRFLGLEVGVIVHGLNDEQRKLAYAADVTYGTNNEFGFDYLRDNMKFSLDHYVQRPLNYAIVDEVDSILIDEARTPLIISGPTEESTDKYYQINRVIPRLKRETDYAIDEEHRQVTLTEDGVQHVEGLLGVKNLYEPVNMEVLHHVNQALRAHTLYKRDVEYVVKEGQVVIVDEFTGRLMPGRRWSEGLHQAIEAKEGVTIANENQTLATITFQNYFRMYNKLAGMTGTADTEAAEFHKIYKLDVVVIPPNLPMIRQDFPDVIYRTKREKAQAVLAEIQELHERGQPVLVGTISIEDSEKLSGMLKGAGIPHHVLNAKHHEREAEIIAQAGRKGALTISTNMAGRGTDIMLGGNPEFLAKRETAGDSEEYDGLLVRYREQCAREKEEVIEAGGLHILGTERHEARRIDNQLRGRSGRQGDPGSSRFYLSLEDDLLRIFGSDRISGLMGRLGMEEGEPIEHSLVTRAIENAQKKVEARNFDIRKHLLEYDDVMNKQRQVIYAQRREILDGEDASEILVEMIQDLTDESVEGYAPPKTYPEDWNLDGLDEAVHRLFGVRLGLRPSDMDGWTPEALKATVEERLVESYRQKRAGMDEAVFRRIEKEIVLYTIDSLWKDHLLMMDHLREGIGLRGYGQRDPLKEYQKEGYDMFVDLQRRLKEDAVSRIFRVQVVSEEDATRMSEQRRRRAPLVVLPGGKGASGAGAASPARSMGPGGGRGGPPPRAQATVRREGPKVGPNDPCPCGSGKKYKKCCRR